MVRGGKNTIKGVFAMKMAHEYKGYYLDVFYVDGYIHGVIRDRDVVVQGLTIQELLENFKSHINLIS